MTRDAHPGSAGSASGSVMDVWTTRGDGIENLRLERVPIPDPQHGQLLVKTAALSLNYRDLLVIGGVEGWQPQSDVVPVSDAVGVVVAVGPEVTRFAVGDRVSAIFLPKWHTGPLTRQAYVSPVGGPVNRGMLADYVVIDEQEVARPPRSLDDAQAATLPIAAVTAWHAMARRSQVRQGDTVLIHGTGGVALFALQFAVALGARAAITSSSDDKLTKARALGAQRMINYRNGADIAADVREWTGGVGVDHVIETIGGDNLNQSLRAVAIGGSISFIGLIEGRSAHINTYEFVSKNVNIFGIETGSREMFEDMARFVDEHDIRPVIDSTFPVTGVQAALERLAAGGHFGKIVITK
jgi:NADPH:quinone reductase-like Zn-dependent oxidoreductase